VGLLKNISFEAFEDCVTTTYSTGMTSSLPSCCLVHTSALASRAGHCCFVITHGSVKQNTSFDSAKRYCKWKAQERVLAVGRLGTGLLGGLSNPLETRVARAHFSSSCRGGRCHHYLLVAGVHSIPPPFPLQFLK